MAESSGSDRALDSKLPWTCPECGNPVRFVCTVEDAVAQLWSAPLFECRTHGMWYGTRDGLRREPPATHV
jgi:hypothetical protein